MLLHYDPDVTITRPMNAAAVAGFMRERVPDATADEVRMAARGLARSFGGRWGTFGDTPGLAARDFWADSVVVSWRLMDADRPF